MGLQLLSYRSRTGGPSGCSGWGKTRSGVQCAGAKQDAPGGIESGQTILMSEKMPQNLKNHARFDPFFHPTGVVLVANLIVAIVWMVRVPDFVHGWVLVLSITAIPLVLRVRQYPIRVQDRVIRLEERLRLQALGGPEFQSQINRLTEDQLIGLRFAGDGEVVALARQALEENLNRKQIKERIRDWRPDEWRV